MTEEERAKYLDLIPRVFVRALRDPHGADLEYELSEGQATSLLRAREDAAAERALAALRRLERAAANMLFSDTFVGERADDMMVNTTREIGLHKELYFALAAARAALAQARPTPAPAAVESDRGEP